MGINFITHTKENKSKTRLTMITTKSWDRVFRGEKHKFYLNIIIFIVK